MDEVGRRMLRIRLLHLLKKARMSARELLDACRKTYLYKFESKYSRREFWLAIAHLIKGGNVVFVKDTNNLNKKVYAITNQGYNKVTSKAKQRKIKRKEARSPFHRILSLLFPSRRS